MGTTAQQRANDYLMGRNQPSNQQALATLFNVPVSSINPNVGSTPGAAPKYRMGAYGSSGGGGSYSSGSVSTPQQAAEIASSSPQTITERDRAAAIVRAGISSDATPAQKEAYDQAVMTANDMSPSPITGRVMSAKEQQTENALAGLGLLGGGVGLVSLGGLFGIPILAGAGYLTAGASAPGIAAGTEKTYQAKTGVALPSEKDYKAAVQAGFVSVEEDISKQNMLIQFGYQIPGAQLLQANQENFVAGATAELVKRGYSQAEAQTLAVNVAQSGIIAPAFGEIAGTIIASGGTEILGREAVKQTTKNYLVNASKYFDKGLFARSALGIAPAGAIEGAAFYGIQQTARSQPINLFEGAMYAAGGAVSAGLLGGAIATLSAGKASIAGKALLGGAYGIDPTEPAGDIIGTKTYNLFGFAEPAFRTIVPVPTSVLPVSLNAPAYSEQGVEIPAAKRREAIKTLMDNGKVNADDYFGIKTPSNVNPNAPTVADTVSAAITDATKTPTNVNPFNFTNNVSTSINTPTTVSSLTNVFTPVSIPVIGAEGLLFPPMFGEAGGGGTGRRGSKLRYYDEFAQARKFLSFGREVPKIRIKKRSRK